MAFRFPQPETVRIDLGNGDWIEVKKELTHKESKDSHKSMITDIRGSGADVRFTPNMDVMGDAEVLAYLVAWSGPMPIDTPEKLKTALGAISQEDFRRISEAVSAHVAQMEAARDDAKKSPDTSTAYATT